MTNRKHESLGSLVAFLSVRLVLVAILLIGLAVESSAQLGNFKTKRFQARYPGEIDTLGSDRGIQTSLGAALTLEREVDAGEYVLGPGDNLIVSIWSTESVHVTVPVTPEGKVVIPRAGVVSVRGRTLADASNEIVDEVKKVYRSPRVDVSLASLRSFRVYVLGAVRVPSIIVANGVDRVFDVIQRAGGVLDTGSVRGITVIRDEAPQPILADLQRYLSTGDKRFNPVVQGGDRIIVPLTSTKNVISISGEVPQEGTFDFQSTDSLSTLIRFAGGFLPSARLDSVLLVRVSEQGGSLEEIVLDLSSWRSRVIDGQTLVGDVPLRAGDRVYIRAIPKWRERHEVVVTGEVRYPGRYPIEPGITHLSDIITRAGGFTSKASLEDGIVIRTSEINLEDREFKRLEKLQASEMSTEELQYFKTKSREKRGVMSVSFTDLFSKNVRDNDPVMRDKDSIHVPERNLYVNVTGSVRNPGRIVFKNGLNYDDYINLAGGYGFRADRDATLVIKVKGDVFPADNERYQLEPGDNIVVLDVPETKFIDVFTQALTIAAQIVTVVGVVITLVRLR